MIAMVAIVAMVAMMSANIGATSYQKKLIFLYVNTTLPMTLPSFTLPIIYKMTIQFRMSDLNRNIRFLSSNPSPIAMDILSNNLDYVFWTILSENPAAIRILEDNIEHISWRHLCLNPAAIHLLKRNKGKIDWKQLSLNPNGWQILQDHLEHVDWYYLSMSCNSLEFMRTHMDHLDWKLLSSNAFAIELLEEYPDKIDWNYLAENTAAIELLSANQNRIRRNWCIINRNPAAKKLIINITLKYRYPNKDEYEALMNNKNIFEIYDESHSMYSNEQLLWDTLTTIGWQNFCSHPKAISKIINYPRMPSFIGLLINPNLFAIDYEYLRESKKELHVELIAALLHPDRVSRYIYKQSNNGYKYGCLDGFLM